MWLCSSRLLSWGLPLWAAAQVLFAQTLTEGRRITLEASLEGNQRLIARAIRPASRNASRSVTGRISSLRERGGLLWAEFGPLKVSIPPDMLVTGGHEKLPANRLRPGMRVRILLRRASAVYVARSIRLYPSSTRTSLSLTGDAAGIDAKRGRISVHGVTIHLRSRTRYTGFTESAGALSPTAPFARRDDDELNPDPIRVGPATIAGYAGTQFEARRDWDLNASREERLDRIGSLASLSVTMPLGENAWAFAKILGSSLTRPGLPAQNGTSGSASLREAYLMTRLLHPALAIQIGRQRFRDSREWLFDESLDAIRLHLRTGRLRSEWAAARSIWHPGTARRDQLHWLASTQYRLPGGRSVGAYLLHRNDVSRSEQDPTWLGWRSYGPVTSGFHYWLESARLWGKSAGGRLRGHAADAGLAFKLRKPLRPSFSASYAYGSGDKNRRDSVDSRFRQTGLQDTTSRLSGLKRIHSYGILTAPELSNLRVLSAEAGIQPRQRWSLTVRFHQYRQLTPSRTLPDMRISATPNGRDPRLGREFDTVFTMRRGPSLETSLYVGLFLPGPAFSAAASSAVLFRTELRYYF